MKISVLIPAYNVEAYIEECLSSICQQIYCDLQIVVINDGSHDHTLELLQRIQASDKRIEIYSRPNKGVATTRNELLAKIKGDAFIFIDADDWIEPNMIGWMVKSLTLTNSDIAMCGTFRNVTSTSLYDNKQTWDSATVIKKFLQHNELTGSLCNKLIKTRVLGNNKFLEGISYGEDALFLWNIIKQGVTIVKSDIPQYHYRTNTEGLTYSKFGYGKFTGSTVWLNICTDVDCEFRHLSSLCHAQYAHQMVMLLFDAARSGYKEDDKIKFLINAVRINLPYLKQSRIESLSKLLFAHACTISYPVARRLLKVLYK